MAKQKKKRTKKYQGAGAKSNQPSAIRVTAVKRSKLGRWWQDNKGKLKIASIAAAVTVVVVWLLVNLVQMFI